MSASDLNQPLDSKIAHLVGKNFPRAITNAELVQNVSASLDEYGFGESTLLATSLCCDEVTRVLERDLEGAFGTDHHFSMGGLAGFAFCGVVGFGAMAHHVPDGGSCLIVYGPHVGIDHNGKVGSVNRRGRDKPGGCCGSALAAHGHVCAVHSGDANSLNSEIFSQPHESQQAHVATMLMPYAERLIKSPEPMVELPLSLFDAQKKLMDKIVAAGCQEVHDGNIALLGGIQINTPDGESDYFLPLTFEIRNNENVMISDLMWK